MRTPWFAVLLVVGCTRAEPPLRATPEPAKSVTTDTPSATDVEGAWHSLLAAMRAGDDATIERFTTEAGRASLRKGVVGEDEHTTFARWGKGWSEWPIRWRTRTATRAEAALGPEAKEHSLTFVRVDGGWKLDRWLPGE